MNTKIAYILTGIVLLGTFVFGISRGVAGLEEQVQTRHDSIPQAIEHLLK